MSKNIFIVGGNQQYRNMWLDAGHYLVTSVNHAHIVQFTGGEDVHPAWYRQRKHMQTHSNQERDIAERAVYLEAKELKIPCVGICRGGQFLNVMNGGSLIQHCNNHGVHDGHLVTDLDSWETYNVTSTHHQMMVHNPATGEVVATAAEATVKEVMVGKDCVDIGPGGVDTEVVWYSHTKDLCFQPHPEFSKDETRKYYFDLIERYEVGV